jgi:biotin carboxyl carrier protein
MKKYLTTIESTDLKADTELLSNTKAVVNGKEYEYDVKFLNQNVMVLRMNGENFYLTCVEDEDDLLEIGIDSDTYRIKSKSELDILVEKLSGSKGDTKVKKEVYSPMPGIIKKLNVTEGQDVRKGEVLLVLEAMKMENEIKAVKDCKIKKINVEPMSSVEKNELLIMLE